MRRRYRRRAAGNGSRVVTSAAAVAARLGVRPAPARRCWAPEPVFIANTVAAVGLAVPALLAFAVLSAAGARDPAAHLPILRTEILYKLVWIGTMLPHLRKRPRAARLAASSAVMVAGYAAALAEAGQDCARKYGERALRQTAGGPSAAAWQTAMIASPAQRPSGATVNRS